jgi:hypothetical protein
MEPEHSLQCPQEAATGHYPKPNESSSHPHILFHFNIILLYTSWSEKKSRDSSAGIAASYGLEDPGSLPAV